MNSQTLARALLAAGSAKAQTEEGTYLLEVRDGNIVEKLWVGDSVINETPIASDAKDNSSASILFPPDDRGGHKNRLVYFINKSNLIECYSFDEDISPEWQNVGLSKSANFSTSPDSKLCSIATCESGVVLSYEDKDGRLIVAYHAQSATEWESLNLPEARARKGTHLRLLDIQKTLNLFFVGEDGRLHYFFHDPKTQEWQDQDMILENTDFDHPIDNFNIAVDPETKSPVASFLVGDTLWLVDKNGKTRLGELQSDGGFVPDHAAQDGIVMPGGGSPWGGCRFCNPNPPVPQGWPPYPWH